MPRALHHGKQYKAGLMLECWLFARAIPMVTIDRKVCGEPLSFWQRLVSSAALAGAMPLAEYRV